MPQDSGTNAAVLPRAPAEVLGRCAPTGKPDPACPAREKQPGNAACVLLLQSRVPPMPSGTRSRELRALCSTNTGLKPAAGAAEDIPGTKQSSHLAAAPSLVALCASPCPASFQCFYALSKEKPYQQRRVQKLMQS